MKYTLHCSWGAGAHQLELSGPEAHHAPTEKEKLAAYEGVQATSGVAGREASSFDITAACPTLDVPRKHPLNTSHNQR